MKYSHTVFKDFDTCPRQFAEVRVYKRVKKEFSESANAGDQMHKAAESYVKEGAALPEQYVPLKPYIDVLVAKGKPYAELEIGVTREFAPAGFADKDTWIRGKFDLVIRSSATHAFLADYKTGSSRYADTNQLLLGGLLLMANFPEIQKVSGGLIFFKEGKLIKSKLAQKHYALSWKLFEEKTQRIEAAIANDNFPAKPSGLCRKFCPVLSCEHNGRSS